MKIKIFLMLSISLLGICSIVGAQAQHPAGSPDTSFGAEGKVFVRPFYTSKLTAIAVQPDGKIVAAGRAEEHTTESKLILMRLNHNGTLDSSFADSGILRTQFPAGNALHSTLLIQPDGKILITLRDFYAPVSKPSSDFIVLRFNADGSLDNSFGINGKATADFSGAKDVSQTMALQADGKIVVAGGTSLSNSSFALARFNPDGTLDNTFNTSGQVVTNFPGVGNTISAISIESNGKIVVAATVGTSKDTDIRLARYNSDGSLDSSFGMDGSVTTDLDNYEETKSLLVQADGKLLVVGTKFPAYLEYTQSDIFIVRYNSDGSLDKSFGEAGKIITDFGKYEDVYAATLQADGKFVIAGAWGTGHHTRTYSLSDFLAVRYNPDGTFDKDFGDNGKISTDFGRVEIARDVAVDKDGNIILAGYTGEWTFDGFDQSDFAFARYIGVPPKPLPDFALSTGATTINAARGSKVKLSIQIDHLNGFTGSITVRAPDTSNLKIVIPEPVQTTTGTSVDFKLKIKKGTPAGNHQLVFTGKDDSGKEHSATITIVIE
jgi:uncharacterized delta-60 repeat protein